MQFPPTERMGSNKDIASTPWIYFWKFPKQFSLLYVHVQIMYVCFFNMYDEGGSKHQYLLFFIQKEHY